MPLIRYKTGDYTRFLAEPCPCGGVTRRLDTVRRARETPDIVDLDSALFALSGLIDYSARLDGGQLIVDAVGTVTAEELEGAARALYPALGVKAGVRPASPDFCGCCAGKRCIL